MPAPTARHLLHPRLLLGLLLALLLPPTARAQTVDASPPPGVPNQSLRIYQQERSAEDQRLLDERVQQLQRLAPSTPQPPTQATPPGDRQCWPVTGLRLTGNRLIDNATLRAVAIPHLSPCMGPQAINALLMAVTRAYVDLGLITARPRLEQPPQAGQPLELVIEEGFVESIELTDQSLAVSLDSAFPSMLGRPLQLRDLENGLDQLNRLKAFDLTADLAPGRLPGGTRIVLRPQRTLPRWGLTSALDNHGYPSVGRRRLSAFVNLDSPLGLNDALLFGAIRSLDSGINQNQWVTLDYRLPYGTWTAGVQLLDSQSSTLAGQDLYRTTFHSEALTLGKALWRDQNTLLNATLGLRRKRFAAAWGGREQAQAQLGIQKIRQATLEASLDMTRLGNGQLWAASLGYTRGLRSLDTHKRQPRAGAPDPYFERYRLTGEYRRALVRGEPSLEWRSQLTLQYSNDLIPALDQLALAEHSAVRGWRNNSASASSGAVWRNTLKQGWNLSPQLNLSPFVAIDLATALPEFDRPSLRLGGLSSGAILDWKGTQLTLEYQHGLFNSNRAQRPEPPIWLMSLNTHF